MASFDGWRSTIVAVPAVSRIKQGLSALFGQRSNQRLPARYLESLPIGVIERWNRLASYDRRHLLAVADDLRREERLEDIVLAGLLHDIGKPERLRIATRVVAVVVERIGNNARTRSLKSSWPVPGLRQLQATLRHARAGGDFLSQHDVSSQVVWLVRHHESDLSHPDLQALQAADARH